MIWVIHLTLLLLFQLVSLSSFNRYQYDTFLYTHMCLFCVCMFALHIVSISIGIYFSHTYIDVSFVPIIFIYFRAQILFLHSLILNDYIFNWYDDFNKLHDSLLYQDLIISILSLIVHFSWWNVFHITLVHSLYYVSHDCVFHEYKLCYMDFECFSDHVIFMFHEKYFCYSLLEGFRTSWLI